MPTKVPSRKAKSTLKRSYLRLAEHLVRQYGLSLEFLASEPTYPRDTLQRGTSQLSHSYQPDHLLTSEQAATVLGLRSKTLANWRVEGIEKLPFRRIGGAVRYQYRDLLSFIETRKHENTSQY